MRYPIALEPEDETRDFGVIVLSVPPRTKNPGGAFSVGVQESARTQRFRSGLNSSS